MQDDGLRCALRPQYVQDLAVGVAVVDHQRLVQAFCQLDVPCECLPLDRRIGATLEAARPVEVQPGLADRHHSRVGGQ